MARKVKVEKMQCLSCGVERYISRDFYKTSSRLYKYTNDRIPICKNCMIDIFNELLTLYDGKHNETFRHWCTLFDIFYDDLLYIECCEKDNFIGEYMRLVSSTKDRRDKTSFNNDINSKLVVDNVGLDDGVISTDISDFWGEGYTAKEYARLERKYKKYSENYPNKRLQEQEMIKSLCELELMREKCRKNDDRNGYDKITTQIRKTMDDLRILPKQSADEEEQLTIGYIIKQIEYNEPIPDKHEEFNDINGIEKLIEKYFVTPFKRVMGLKKLETGDKDEE